MQNTTSLKRENLSNDKEHINNKINRIRILEKNNLNEKTYTCIISNSNNCSKSNS